MRTRHDRSDGGELMSWLYDHLRGRIYGNMFFVSSTGDAYSSASGPGYSPEQAFLTIDQAVSAATANNGDGVIVLPNHTETITAAAGLDLDVEGLTIIGIGNGRARPKINFTTAATADMDVDAANITMENFYFDLTSVDGLDAPLDINATDFTLRNCEIEMADSGGQCDLVMLTDANASRLTVDNCRFMGSTDAGTTTAINIVGGDGHLIQDCLFIGNFTTSIGAITSTGTLCTNTHINRNSIYNRTASSTKAIVMLTGSTGIISRNVMQILNGTAPITGDAMAWLENTYSAAIATAGSAT